MRNARIYHLLITAFVGLIAYSNTLSVPLVFDDVRSNVGISDNPIIQDVNNFISSAKGYEYNPRRFVGYFTFALNYHFGKLNVTGYHIVNLTIHLINAILVYFMVVLTFTTPYFNREKLNVKRETSDKTENRQRRRRSKMSPHMIHDSRLTIHDSRFIALFSALLFVSHPVQTQAVTYIIQRFTSLATMFYLASLVLYVKGRLLATGNGQWEKDKGRNIAYRLLPIACFFLSFLSALLAMRTKEIAFTLPIMIALYEFVFFETTRKKKLLFLLCVILSLLIIASSLFSAGRSFDKILSDLDEETRAQAIGSRWVYLFTEMRVIMTYIRLIFLPINQNLDYDYPVYHSLFTPSVFLSFLFLASLLGTAVYLLYRSGRKTIGNGQWAMGNRQWVKASIVYRLSPIAHYRLIAFGIFWFFIALSIESSVLPIADVIFEHRVYLPSVGAFIAIAAAVFLFINRVIHSPLYPLPSREGKQESKPLPSTTIPSPLRGEGEGEGVGMRAHKIVIAALTLVVLTLSVTTYARNTVWQDPVRLWEDTAAKSPGNIRPHFNLGNAYARRGDYENAVAAYLAAINTKPKGFIVSEEEEYLKVSVNLAIAYCFLGRYDDAIKIFKSAIEKKPDFLDAYNNLAAAYISCGRSKEAIEPLEKVLRMKPDHIDALYNLALVYHMTGDHNSAVRELTRLRELAPLKAEELATVLR